MDGFKSSPHDGCYYNCLFDSIQTEYSEFPDLLSVGIFNILFQFIIYDYRIEFNDFKRITDKKSVYSQISIPVFECAVGIGEFGILINRDVHCHADNRGAVSCDITADANSYLLYIYVRDGTGYPAFGIDSVF